jgi:hypothetical protein
MTKKTAIVGIALCALVLAACGSGGGGGSSERLAQQYLPRDVWAVGGMDTTGLRGTEYYAKAREQMDEALEESGMLESFQAAGFDLDSMDRAVFGIGGDPMSQYTTLMLFVLEGSFDGDQMLTLMREEAEKEGKGIEEIDVAGVTCLKAGGEDMLLATPAPGVLMGADAEAMRMGLEVAREGKPSIEENEEIVAMMKTVETGGNFWMAGIVPEQAKQMASGVPMANALAQVGAFAFSTTLDDGVSSRLVGRYSSEDAAEQAKIQAQGLLQMVKGMMSMNQEDPELTADVTELMDGLTVESDGSDVVIALEVAKPLLDRLVARAEKEMD